ncbi:RluA family pseudouridine synthase [Paracoccaceae bacterium GXU_MW_L88]
MGSVSHIRVELEISGRLDKALAEAAPDLSRSRLKVLIEAGAVSRDGTPASDAKMKVEAGEVWDIAIPEAEEIDLIPQNIPLDIVFEDDDLIVVNKPAGLTVHPGAGQPDGTLVNALMYHCGDRLSGIGGEKRPGIVHRIDKDTSGLLVVAKSDSAHQGLAAQFAAHDLERQYRAFCWGVPSPGDPRLAGLTAVRWQNARLTLNAPIARHRHDRKKMAIVEGGKRAVTHVEIAEPLTGSAEITCRLETGRTHQIRVHMAHIGHPLIGDPVYGGGRSVPQALSPAARDYIAAFPRQALHAETLGFRHPVSDEMLRFSAPLPEDMQKLRAFLTDLNR